MSRGTKSTLAVLLSLAVLAGAFVTVQLLRPVPDPTLSVEADGRYTFPGARAGGETPALDWPDEGQAAVALQGQGMLGTYGEQRPAPIASVAKVMTAYIILRDHPLSDTEEIKVDARAEQAARDAAESGESVVWVSAGETMTQEEALQALLIASGNNIARLLARWDAGSEEAFVEKMNRTAERLGMQDTTYTDPSGLAATTVSTAVDQVKLAREAMKNEAFREIAAQREYVHADGTRYETWNSLLGTDGVVGIKTGTTTPAGGNLLFAAERSAHGEQQLLIGAVFGQHTEPRHETVLTETRQLLGSAWSSVTQRTVVDRGEVLGNVRDDFGRSVRVVAEEPVSALGWAGRELEIRVRTEPPSGPAVAGTRVGTLTVGEESTPLVLKRTLEGPGFGDRLTRGF